jgi:hypothetical protein
MLDDFTIQTAMGIGKKTYSSHFSIFRIQITKPIFAMAIVAPLRFCKKTFISTAHQKSQVILDQDRLMYRLDEKYIFSKDLLQVNE